ncbi:VOC family protein [Aquipuribacter hungaricus]|uniref:VOC family protein n=1 Tax=Aquipuribacter hungaricus TaxID=545624 RepID=A0ABV7WKQ3_9MICO
MFSGIHHVALTVTDLAVSVAFYEKVLQMAPAVTMTDGPFTRRVFTLPGGQGLGLTQHDQAGGGRFDATVPGLDHVGLACATRDDVTAWAEHLDRVGVAHSGVQDAAYGTALSFTDPDGNALEFFTST